MENMWVIRAGKDTKNFNLYKKENFVAVGEDIGDVKNLSLDEMKFRLKGKANNVNTSAGVIRRFRDEVKIRDYFISTSPNSEYLLLGEILGDIKYNPDLSQRYQYTCYRRPVKWISKIYRNDLSDAARRAISPQTTVFRVKEKWQKEIFKNQIALDFTPKDNVKLNKNPIDSSDLDLQDNNKEVFPADNLETKFKLKKEGLKLEKSNPDEAIRFYKSLITNKLFLNDYYQFKRLSVVYHKVKDYENEKDIIKYFLKSGIYCNIHQFLSFKYKLKKLIKKDLISYKEANELAQYFKENGFKNKYESELCVPCEKIKKDSDTFVVISDDDLFKKYGRRFLKPIANGLFYEKNNQEAFVLLNLLLYDFKYTSVRHYEKLCKIYRRTKNYPYELLIIKEYFNTPNKQTKRSDKWFNKRLTDLKELINDDQFVNSVMDAEFKKAEHLAHPFDIKELNLDLDYHFDNEKLFEITEEKKDNPSEISVGHSAYNKLDIESESIVEITHEDKNDFIDEEINFMQSEKLNVKADLIKEGLKLEDTDRQNAISFYEELLSNELFANDYYPYRRLVQLYPKNKDLEGQCNIIKTFFNSGIYCNKHQFLWFRNKLRRLIKKGLITEEEIAELENIFEKNGSKNKKLSNTPVVIGDRIKTKRGEPYVQSEEKYDRTEKTWEREEIAHEHKRQKEYDDAIKCYEEMVYELNYRSYRYYDELYHLYVKQNYLDKALNIVKAYYNGNSSRTKHSDGIFEKNLIEIKELLDLNDEEIFEKISNDNDDSDDNENDVFNSIKRQTSLAKSFGIDNEFSHIISIMNEYDIDLEKPINIYPYDETLSESENINRKFYLIEFTNALDTFKLYDDLINLYKIYTKNDYFENDWYPYRQLYIIYSRANEKEAALEIIKELFLSGIWLNNYQFTYFTNKIRSLIRYIDIDESQVQSWLDFYDLNGANNKGKMNYPTVLAERMRLEDDKIYVQSEEAFELSQKIKYFEETGKILESKRKYDLAINFYQEKIDYYPLFTFYKKICLCFEKLEDYEGELDCIKEYYQNPPKDVTYESESWFKSRLKKVNTKLGTDFSDDDLKIKNKS